MSANLQEQHWSGPEGDAYHERSPGDAESNYHFFQKALRNSKLQYDANILELGCGTGANLLAMQRCFSYPKFTGVDISQAALDRAPKYVRKVAASILEWEPDDKWDLVLTKGVLIHVAPALLDQVYNTIVRASRRYVLVCEYFCPTPRMIPYRGKENLLWARDFAGEIIDRHGLKLVDYGFVSRRDEHPQDDINFWLLEKP